MSDKNDEIKRLMDGLEYAWGVIANAYDPVRFHGEESGSAKTADKWKTAADCFRDEHWHPALKRNQEPQQSLPGELGRDQMLTSTPLVCHTCWEEGKTPYPGKLWKGSCSHAQEVFRDGEAKGKAEAEKRVIEQGTMEA